MSEQFCLRWNNHQSTLISVFETLLESGSLIDCTLCAEGQLLKAHKVVLSACSPIFESMLCIQEDKHPIIFLKDVKFIELKAMLDYMYKGEVNILQDQLDSFLRTAAALQIKGLTDQGGGGGDEPPAKKGPGRKTGMSDVAPESPLVGNAPLREGSVSPTRRRRRIPRRPSSAEDASADNSCDIPPPAVAPPAITPATGALPVSEPLHRSSLSATTVKAKQEPIDTPLVTPKQEFVEETNEEIEDLTLDDDDDYNDSMSDMSKPGTSFGAMNPGSTSQQDFSQWQQMMGAADRSGTDEVFMAAQEAINNQTNTQVPCRRSTRTHRAPTRCDCPDCNAGEDGNKNSSGEWKASPIDGRFMEMTSAKGAKLMEMKYKKKVAQFKVPFRRIKSGLHKCVCGETYLRRDYLFRHMKSSCELARAKMRKVTEDDGSAINPFGAYYEKKFKCDCGKKYYHPHNLVRHKKTSCRLLKGGNIEKKTQYEDYGVKPAEKPQREISFTCDCGQTFHSSDSIRTHRNTNCPRLVGKSSSSNVTSETTKVVHTRKWGTVTGPPWICDCGKKSNTIWGYYRHRQHGECSGANDAAMKQDGVDDRSFASTSGSYVPYDALTPEVSLQLVESLDEFGVAQTEDSYEDLPDIDMENMDDLIEPQVEAGIPQYKCACGKSFSNGKQLGGHSRACRKRLLGGAAYKCHCGLKFPTKKRLVRHMSQRHQKSPMGHLNIEMTDLSKKIKVPKTDKEKIPVEKPFDCVCGKSYANEFLLTRHIKNNCGLDLRCPLCGKNHPFKARLYFHMRDVHGLRPETVYPFRPQDEVTDHPSLPASAT